MAGSARGHWHAYGLVMRKTTFREEKGDAVATEEDFPEIMHIILGIFERIL
jgi:hypothetical protein